MRLASLLALLLAAPSVCLAIDPPTVREFTLDEAERTAVLNNAALLSSEQDIVIAQQRVQESRFQFFPEVGLQATASRYDARYPFALAPEFRSSLLFPSPYDGLYSARAYLRQPIYEGGRTLNLLRLAQAALKQAQTQYETAKADVAFNTKKAFYRLLFAQEVEGAVRERLESARRTAERTPNGWERVEAEALAAALRARETAATHAVENARLELLKGLSLELDTPVRVIGKLETVPIDVDLDKAIVWATELRPELQAETYKAQMDAIAVNLAIGRKNPTLVMGGDYEVTGQRFPLRQNNWDLTVGLKVPFSYDFWTQLRQKRAEQRQGDIKRADIHDRVRLEVRQAYEDLRFWQIEWPMRDKEHQNLQTLAQHADGHGPAGLAALRAQIAVLDARERWLESVEAHLLARARLERAVGRPLER